MKVKKAQAEEGQGKENPANPGWKENVMEELNALGYELEEDHSGEIQVKMEIPMDQFGRVLADYHPTCPEQTVSKEQRLLHEDIVRTMFPKIQNGSREKLKVLAGQDPAKNEGMPAGNKGRGFVHSTGAGRAGTE